MARMSSKQPRPVLTSVLVFFCSLTALCSGSSWAGQSKDRRLESPAALSVWYKDVGSRSSLIENILQEFGRQYGLRIQPESFIDLPSALLKARERSLLPLAVLGPGDLVGLWRELDLSPVPMSFLHESDIAVMAEGMLQGEKPRGVPILGGNHHVAFYNKQYLSAPPKRWQDLRERMPELRSKGVIPAGWDYQQPFFFLAFMDSASLFAAGKVQLDTPAHREACRSYKQLADAGIIPHDCDFRCLGQRFYSGEIAMVLTTDWNFQDAMLALQNNFAVAPLPETDHGPMRSIMLGTALFFPGNSLRGAQREALLKLAAYLQSDSVQTALGLSYQIPIRRSVMNSLPFKNDSNWRMVIDQMERAQALVAPSELTSIWDILHKGLWVYLSGSVDLDTVFRRMQTQADAATRLHERPGR